MRKGKKKYNIAKGDAVFVVWKDAVGENGGWTYEISEEEQLAGSICKSAGFYVGQSDGLVHIAQIYREADEAYSRVLSIPIGCLVNVLKLEK